MPALCRDCLTEIAPATRCPACGGPRILSHPELFELSIAHLDADAFYAAVEKREDPTLADRPVIVGGGRRGVVSAACYVARIRGVRSAMPMYQALQLCPDAIVLRPRMALYTAIPALIRAPGDLATALTAMVEENEVRADLAPWERDRTAVTARDHGIFGTIEEAVEKLYPSCQCRSYPPQKCRSKSPQFLRAERRGPGACPRTAAAADVIHLSPGNDGVRGWSDWERSS